MAVLPFLLVLFFEVFELADGVAEAGSRSAVGRSTSPLYDETNFPSTALCPAAPVVFGEIVMTPFPLV